jgi:murein biosynthesis integral membrane protein MurJ
MMPLLVSDEKIHHHTPTEDKRKRYITMSQPFNSGTSQPLSTTTARMAAIRLKSANKYIFRALLSLASANLMIRIMGMLNQIVVAARFGGGAAMDAYTVGQSVPSTLSDLLSSGLEASVIPIYTQVRVQQGREKASRLFSTLLNILALCLLAFVGLMLLFRNQLISALAPGLPSPTHNIALSLAPFIFPVLIFMAINSFMECLLNAMGQFGWPAYAGVLGPLTTMVLVIIAGKTSAGLLILCVGLLLGEALQLIVISIRAHRAKIRYRLMLDLKQPELKAIWVVGWPATLGALISLASPLVDQMFAAPLHPGSIYALNRALSLIGVPTGVLFSSVGRAALPYLSSQAKANNMKAFKETLRLYLWAIGIGTLGLSAFMIVLSRPIVYIIFRHGNLTDDQANLIATTFIGFAIGLTPMAIGFIVARAFSALGKTKILMYVTGFSVVANAVFDAIFAHYWQSFGIALSTSAVYCCTMIILIFTLRSIIGKLYLLRPPREVMKVLWRVGLGQYYINWLIWKEENFSDMRLPYGLRKNVIRGVIIAVAFISVIAGTILNRTITLSAAFGSIILLAFFRYRYFLLLVWVLLNAFIGSNIAAFSGNHFLSGLTIPTLLLLFVFPTKEAFKRMVALPIFLAFIIWVLLGSWHSPLSMGQFFTDWTIMLDAIGISVLTIFVITDRKRMLHLIDMILLPSVFIALYGIYGYIVKKNGVISPSTSLFRISSIFGNTPPTFALFLSIIIPLAIYRTFTLRGARRLIGLGILLIFLAALGLTFTRAALATVPVSIIVMIIFLPSRRLRISLIAGLIVVAALVVLVSTVGNLPIFSRFFSADVVTLNGRIFLWQAIIDHFDPTNLLGMGLHSSDALLTNLQVSNGGRGVIATATHNIFLESLYEEGIPGALFLVMMFIAFAVSLLRKVRQANDDYRMLLAMAIAVLFNVVVQSFESNDFWNPSVGLYFWIVMALPFAMCWTAATRGRARVMADAESNDSKDAIAKDVLSKGKQLVTI